MIFEKDQNGFLAAIDKEIRSFFNPGEKVAVKLHMGEKGNKTYLSPDFVKKIVSILIENNCNPFLFDSPVMYPGARDTEEKYLRTAQEHGFTRKNIGCDIVISNDFVKEKTPNLDVEVCRPLAEADSMLVLTHVKGHFCSGIGGSIKNLGMGAVTKKTKADIHEFAKPIVNDNCILCKRCIDICPMGMIAENQDKVAIDLSGCIGCDECVYCCPQKALIPKVQDFDVLISEAAFGVLKKVKKAYYVNALIDLARLCDCVGDNGPIVAPDIGYLASDDIVGIDRASIDMINKAAGKNLFLEINHKDPYAHVKEMEKFTIS